jgi:hypothetical protein
MITKIVLSFLFVMSTAAHASFPLNDSTASPADKTWNIDEKSFWELITFVSDIYKPVFAAVKTPEGESVSWWIEGFWYEKQANIFSKKEKVPPYNWNRWTIQVHGGLARHPFMTKDAFTLAICHEIGHLLGGAPLRDYLTTSTEGQADYYATHVCARKVFGKMEKKRKLIRLGASLSQCDKFFDNTYEQNVCYRTLFASMALAEFIKVAATERRDTDININDNYAPKYTTQLHSTAQCRLDTFVAGHFCDKIWDDKKIPLNRNSVCRNRPECWYVP